MLIAAARKEKIEDRVAAADGAGLKAVGSPVESPRCLQSLGKSIKNTVRSNEKSEFLIFVTPKIVDDSLSFR